MTHPDPFVRALLDVAFTSVPTDTKRARVYVGILQKQLRNSDDEAHRVVIRSLMKSGKKRAAARCLLTAPARVQR